LRLYPVICLEETRRTVNFLSRLGSLWARNLPITKECCAFDRNNWFCCVNIPCYMYCFFPRRLAFQGEHNSTTSHHEATRSSRPHLSFKLTCSAQRNSIASTLQILYSSPAIPIMNIHSRSCTGWKNIFVTMGTKVRRVMNIVSF
jgi:hypothetical protein